MASSTRAEEELEEHAAILAAAHRVSQEEGMRRALEHRRRARGSAGYEQTTLSRKGRGSWGSPG